MKSTGAIKEAALQVIGYLKKTANHGLKFEDDATEAPILQMFSDASFAPDGEESHGAYVIMLQGNLLFWRSGRQSIVALSSAEAELTEVVEAMSAAEAVCVMVEELCESVKRVGATDSQAALAILTTESGNWRTRHLRMRANFARQAIEEGLWRH